MKAAENDLTPRPAEPRGYGGHAGSLRDEIKELLLERGLQPGDPVPSEVALMETLHVSRGSLREALKSLQALEIIETRHGSGMFVGRLSMSAMADGLMFHSRLGEGVDDRSTVADLADLREILESQLIRRVADSATVEQLALLDVLVERFALSVDQDEIDEIDHEFHRELYAGLGNMLVLRMLEAFWRVLSTVRPSLSEAATTQPMVAEKHRRIVDALRAGDADAAEKAMVEHFDGTRDWLSTRTKKAEG
jgi:DNA-binding FadR family transcriptional regulator